MLPKVELTAKTPGFKPGPDNPNWTGDEDMSLVGLRVGWLTVVSPQIQRRNRVKYVLCTCSGCGAEKWVALQSLKLPGYKGCNDPTSSNYHRYGGRGIKCLFASSRDFIDWVEKHLPHPDYKNVELDRIDNDGHYAPGNLRLATRAENALNADTRIKVLWQGKPTRLRDFPSPYNWRYTRKLVAKGLTGEQIIQRFAEGQNA